MDSSDPNLDAAFFRGAPTLSSRRVAVMEGVLRDRLLAEPSASIQVGRFTLRERIGAGAMGTVYLAHDPALRRAVAIKLVHGWGMSAPQTSIVEAQALARLSHENIVEVFDVGLDVDETLFIAMEYVRGQSLLQWLRTSPPWREVARAFLDAGRGLAGAHARGVFHGDFKPENVLRRDDGHIKVIDFGLAKIVEELHTSRSGTGSRHGPVGGTLGYCAPEKLQGSPDSAAADQFSFCVSTYHGLCGLHPFDTSRRSAFLESVARGPMRTLPRGVPVGLARVLERGMLGDAAERWPDMSSLLRALESVLDRSSRPWGRVALGCVALGVVTAGSVRAEATRTQACDGDVRPSWNPERRRAVQQAFEEASERFVAEAAPRVVAALDDHVERLAATQARACEAPRRAVLACLGDRRRDLERFISGIEHGDDLAAAIAGSYALPRASPCLHVPDADSSPETVALDADLDGLTRAYGAGDYEGGAAQAKALLVEATDLGHEPGRARALNLLAAFSTVLGSLEDTQALLQSAYFAARGAREDALALRIARNLVSDATRRGEYRDALYWARHARAAVSPQADAIELSKLDYAESIALMSLNRTDEALERLRVALDTRRSLLGEAHPQTADATFEIGNAHLIRGDLERAAEAYASATAILGQALGPHHPSVADIEHNLGNVEFARGHFEAARRSWMLALRIEEDTLGPVHPKLGGTLANLATAANQVEDREEASAFARRALRIIEAAFGEQHPDLVQPLTELGRAQLAMGEVAQARASFERAVDLCAHAVGEDHALMLGPLAGSAKAALADGDAETALGRSARLVSLEAFESGDLVSKADALWTMARAQADTGVSAEQTARRAAQTYANAGDQPSADAVLAWLEERP